MRALSGRVGRGRALFNIAMLMAAVAMFATQAFAQPPLSFSLTEDQQRDETRLTQVVCDEQAGVVRFRVNNAYQVALVSMRAQLQCQAPDGTNTKSLENLSIGLSNVYTIEPASGELAGRACQLILEGWDPFSSATPGQIITLDAEEPVGCGPITKINPNKVCKYQKLCDAGDFICILDEGEFEGSWWKGMFVLVGLLISGMAMVGIFVFSDLTNANAYAKRGKSNGERSAAQQKSLKKMLGGESM